MLKQNPYESKTNDVPEFVKKDDVDMSVFQLSQEELNEVEDVELIDKPKAKRRIKTNNVLLIGIIACLLLAVIMTILMISKSNQYKSLKSTYDTYVSTTDAKIERLEKDIEALGLENEELKKAIAVTEEKKGEEGENQEPGSSTTLTTGKYETVVRGLTLRTGPGTSYDVCDYDTLPSNIKSSSFDNGCLEENSEIDVKELKQVGSAVWGKLADNVWVCLDSGDTRYVKKK